MTGHARQLRLSVAALAAMVVLAGWRLPNGSAAGTATRIEESAISLVGNWSVETGYSQYSGGRAVYANYDVYDPTAYATLQFSGTAITWIGAKTYNGGLFHWIIDEGAPVERQGTVNTYSATVNRSTSELLANNLAPGQHILKLQSLGINGNNMAHGVPSETYIDAFDVSTTVPEPTTALMAVTGLAPFFWQPRRIRRRDAPPAP